MNLDLSIHRMAFREAGSLGEAQVLVAKKHAELEREVALKQANDGTVATAGVVERLVTDMEAASEQRMQARGNRVDRLA